MLHLQQLEQPGQVTYMLKHVITPEGSCLFQGESTLAEQNMALLRALAEMLEVMLGLLLLYMTLREISSW